MDHADEQQQWNQQKQEVEHESRAEAEAKGMPGANNLQRGQQ